LRRILRLSLEWGKIEKVPPKVQMLPGENERDRVLTDDEEGRYLLAAAQVGAGIEEAYRRALTGIRAHKGETPIKPEDPYLFRDVTTILIDCGLRPEESFRLRWRKRSRRRFARPLWKDGECAQKRAAHASPSGSA
jgi:hypothetical protein